MEVNYWYSHFLRYSCSLVRLLALQMSQIFKESTQKVIPTCVYFHFWKSFFAEIHQIYSFSDFLNWKGKVEFGSWCEKCHTNVLSYQMSNIWEEFDLRNTQEKCISLGVTKPNFRDLHNWTPCMYIILAP